MGGAVKSLRWPIEHRPSVFSARSEWVYRLPSPLFAWFLFPFVLEIFVSIILIHRDYLFENILAYCKRTDSRSIVVVGLKYISMPSRNRKDWGFDSIFFFATILDLVCRICVISNYQKKTFQNWGRRCWKLYALELFHISHPGSDAQRNSIFEREKKRRKEKEKGKKK